MANSFTVFVNTGFTFQERREIGEEIIRFIKARTRAGRGIGGDTFQGPDGDNKYSQNYKNTAEFKLAKRGQSTVNLTLTGEMLNTLEVLDISLAGRIEIGYPDGDEADKSVFMREKGYDFLGLSDQERDVILRRFRDPTATLSTLLRRIVG